MLMISGIDDDTFELKVGTSSATKLPKDGNMKWVEHSGKAIEAGRTALHDLVDDMRLSGAKLLQKDKQVTKTGNIFMLNRETGEPIAAVEERPVPQRIWLATPYFLPTWSVRRSLRRAAARGVDVRLLLTVLSRTSLRKSAMVSPMFSAASNVLRM